MKCGVILKTGKNSGKKCGRRDCKIHKRSNDKGMLSDFDNDYKYCDGVMYDENDYECCEVVDKIKGKYNYLTQREKDITSCSPEKAVNGLSDKVQRDNLITKLKKGNTDAEKILNMDPTKGKYYEWIRSNLKNNQLDDNVEKYLYLFKNFKKNEKLPATYLELKNKLDQEINIPLIDNIEYQHLMNKVYQTSIDNYDEFEKRVKILQSNGLITNNSIELYNGIYGSLIIPLTHKSSCFYAKGTKWCTSASTDDSKFKEYIIQEPLYIWNDKFYGEKFQFFFKTNEMNDSQNNKITKKQFRHFLKIPILQKLFKPNLCKLFFTFKLDNDEIEEAINYCISNSENFKQEYEIAFESPENAYNFAQKVINNRFVKGEHLIANDAELSFNYSKFVLNNAFPLGEKVMSKNLKIAYKYALEVLRGPFLLGETIISQDAQYSTNYARYVLKGPFIFGEPIISKDAECSMNYARHVLGKRFKLGEDLILSSIYKKDYEKLIILYENRLTSSHIAYMYYTFTKVFRKDIEPLLAQDLKYALEYAKDKLTEFPEAEDIFATDAYSSYEYSKIIERRFRKGENEIAKNAEISYAYAKNIIKSRFKEAEDTIAKEPEYAFKYARDVIKRRFEKSEIFIANDIYYSYQYAAYVLKSRFKLAEDSIAKNPSLAVKYARDVIKGRFYNAEPYILKNPYFALEYVKEVIKERLPEAETIIASDAETAYKYAYILKDRFPEGEYIIKTNPIQAVNYARDIIKGRFYEAEPIIISTPLSAFQYVIDVIKGRFPEAEKILLNSIYKQKYIEFIKTGKVTGKMGLRLSII